MNDLHKIEQENGVFLWGGLAGMLGGILFILVMVWVVVFIPPEPTKLTQWAIRFPEIKLARVVENGIYLMALVLEIPLFLSLYWALRKTNLAAALFGSVIGIVGLVSMIVSATPHVAHAFLLDIFHTTGVSTADQAIIALLWQAIWGIFYAMLYVGFIVVPIGLIIFGTSMFGAPCFGKSFGGIIMTLGMIGFVAAIFQMIYPSSIVGVGSYFACLISYFILGWKVNSLPKTL